MVFLARYGSCRNCVFLASASAVAALFILEVWWYGAVVAVGCIQCAYVFKRRAEDFYNYMAPAVYRAFLIDKLDWRRDGGVGADEQVAGESGCALTRSSPATIECTPVAGFTSPPFEDMLPIQHPVRIERMEGIR